MEKMTKFILILPFGLVVFAIYNISIFIIEPNATLNFSSYSFSLGGYNSFNEVAKDSFLYLLVAIAMQIVGWFSIKNMLK